VTDKATPSSRSTVLCRISSFTTFARIEPTQNRRPCLDRSSTRTAPQNTRATTNFPTRLGCSLRCAPHPPIDFASLVYRAIRSSRAREDLAQYRRATGGDSARHVVAVSIRATERSEGPGRSHGSPSEHALTSSAFAVLTHDTGRDQRERPAFLPMFARACSCEPIRDLRSLRMFLRRAVNAKRSPESEKDGRP